MTAQSDPEQPLAAVDLGSNSFHLVLAMEGPEGVRLVDRLREGVRLAAGLTPAGALDAAAQARAIECLKRFGQRIQGLPIDRVRAVGTSTLRRASGDKAFVDAAERALGYPIDIISGREEGRLIYLGVAYALAVGAQERRMVIDIGGGSTEVIVGRGLQIREAESLSLGAVTATQRYFPQAEINAKALKKLEDKVRIALEPLVFRFRKAGWQQAVGASGSIRAISRVLEARGWGPQISRDGMAELRKFLLELKFFSRFKEIKGLKEERAAILAGGFGILNGLMQVLELQHIDIADGALREGVLYELLGRLHQEDTRELTVAALQKRFHLDARRKEEMIQGAQCFFAALAPGWALQPVHWDWLRWAIATFDIGLDIAHEGFHRHSEYILRHADMPGFSRREQDVLASLARLQRKALLALNAEPFAPFSAAEALTVQRLAVLLRICILFYRGHLTPPFLPSLSLANPTTLRLALPPAWQSRAPLLAADLEHEQELLSPHFHLLW